MPPHPTCCISIVILFSPLPLNILDGLSPSQVSSTNPLYEPLLYPIRATCPAHLILPDLITLLLFGEENRSSSSSLYSLLHSTVTLSLLGPNILLLTLFSNTLILCSFMSVIDQVSHPRKTRCKIIVVLNISICGKQTGRRKIRHPEVYSGRKQDRST